MSKTLKDTLDDVLSGEEKDVIRAFWQNGFMRDTVKKVLFWGLNQSGTFRKGFRVDPLQNGAFSLVSRGDKGNEEIGADLRALWEGTNALEAGFNAMSVYDTSDDDKGSNKVNQAR